MRIHCPMPTGSGSHVIHSVLAEKIHGYMLCDYHPYWTLFPPALPVLCRPHPNSELIHTTPDYAIFFHRKRIPLVITFHNFILDTFMDNYSSLAQRLHYKTALRIFTHYSLNIADTVTTVSKFTAEIVREEMGFTGKIKIIYNGIDCNQFSPKTNKYPKKNIRVLFSGNLTRRKGADLLPQIAQHLDGNIEVCYTSGLRTKNVSFLTPKLRNIGAIPYTEMPNVYQQADILLFPTVREGFGLAAAEAMACGLPVVATDCSSLPELVVHGKGGYLCKTGNVKEFAARINQLASSPTLRKEMGEFNRTRVEEKFSVDRMISQYVALFEQLVMG